MLLQFSSNFAQGPFQGYVPDLVPARQVGRASGLMGVMIIFGGMVGVGIAAIGYVQLVPGMAEPTVRAILFWPTVALGFVEVATMVVLALTVDEGRPALPRGKRSWLRIGLSAWGTDILRERSYVWLLISRLCYLTMPGVITAYARVRPRAHVPSRAVRGGTDLLIINGLIIALATAVATVPAARLSDRIGRKRVIYVAFALAAIGVHRRGDRAHGRADGRGAPAAGLLDRRVPGRRLGAHDRHHSQGTAGRYMGISNVATASAGPLGLALAGVVLYFVTLAGLPQAGAPDVDSSTFGVAPRAAIASLLVFLAIAALALRHVNETRRED